MPCVEYTSAYPYPGADQKIGGNEMTNEKREAAIKWLEWEIRSLERAPEINGCPMTKDWAEQLEIMKTCLEAVTVSHLAHIDREALGIKVDSVYRMANRSKKNGDGRVIRNEDSQSVSKKNCRYA